MWYRFTAVALCLAASGGAVSAQEDINPIQMELQRQAPSSFQGGGTLEVVVMIMTSGDPNSITALGLYETIPEGWTFAGMRGINGDPPAVAPAAGTTGVLQFAWINPPVSYPFSMAYTLQIPETDSGRKFISGQVEYRQMGGAQYSAPTITELAGDDRTPPTITLQGPNPLNLPQGTPFTEPGYRANDETDGDLSGSVQVTGSVNHEVPGEYVLTYSVSDRAGNNATAVTRTVIVTATTPGANPGPVAGGGTGQPRPRPNRSRFVGGVPGTVSNNSGTRAVEPVAQQEAAQENAAGNNNAGGVDQQQQLEQVARRMAAERGGQSMPELPDTSALNRVAVPPAPQSAQSAIGKAMENMAARVGDGDGAGDNAAVAAATPEEAAAPEESANTAVAAVMPPGPRPTPAPAAVAAPDVTNAAAAAPQDTTLVMGSTRGPIERIVQSFRDLGPGQLVTLGVIFAGALVVFVVGYGAYRAAYKTSPRRRVSTPLNPGEGKPA